MGLLRKYAKYISRRQINRNLILFCSALPEGVRILNIGSGGVYQDILRKHSPTNAVIFSSDIDASRMPDVVDDITQSKLNDSSFDCVVCLDVLEHVTDPAAAVGNILRILTEGGNFLVSTPYLFPTHDAPYDFYRYTEFGLRNLFNDENINLLIARTSFFETMMLLSLRGVWIFRGVAKFCCVLAFSLIFLISPLGGLFRSKTTSFAFTAGFIMWGTRRTSVGFR